MKLKIDIEIPQTYVDFLKNRKWEDKDIEKFFVDNFIMICEDLVMGNPEDDYEFIDVVDFFQTDLKLEI